MRVLIIDDERSIRNTLKELKFELIDMWHFFMNMMLSLNISSKELFIYYYYKNLENIRRYNSKY